MQRSFPKPTGPYAIGTSLHHWVDESRDEIWIDQENKPRELMIQMWYPTAGNMPQKALCSYDYEAIVHMKEKLAQKQVSPERLSELDGLHTWAKPDAPIFSSLGKRPAILFSHGIQVPRANNTTHAENLASHGYIVIAIGHTYACGLTIFPDGRRAEFRAQKTQALFDQLIADISFVLDTVSDNPSIDSDRIGMFGHSLGGMLTTHMCRLDARVKAGINMDGPLFGKDIDLPFQKPFMFLLAQHPFGIFSDEQLEKWGTHREEYRARLPRLLEALGEYGSVVKIQGAAHNAFSDYAILKHLDLFASGEYRLNTGSIDGYQAIKIVNEHIVSFFDRYLKLS